MSQVVRLFRRRLEHQLIVHLQQHLGLHSRVEKALSIRTIASLIRSAAVPCSGVLTAVRSAKPRALGLRLFMSGMGRSRPNSVLRHAASARTSAMVSSMNCAHAGVALEVVLDVRLRLLRARCPAARPARTALMP